MENLKNKKITKATVKSFIKKNENNLFINEKSSFSGMTDCVEPLKGGFKKATKAEGNLNHNLGVEGAWFVGQSRDYFSYYEDQFYYGIEVYNSCGCFILAVQKL